MNLTTFDLRRALTSQKKPGGAALTTLAVAAVLAACGGGQDGGVAGVAQPAAASRMQALAVTVNPNGWVAVTQPNDALLQNLAIPADAPTRGMWSAVGAWPMNGLHQAVLPDGKVLTWGTTPDGNAQNGRYFDVWNPDLGLFNAASHNFTYDATRQDSFCAPAVYLGDGRLMISGGNGTGNNGVTSQVYSPATNGFAQGASMADQRWYATMLKLADGRPIVLGGIVPYTEGQWTNADVSFSQGLSSTAPEVFENGAWRTLLNAQSRQAFGPDFLRASLPKAWLAPDGRVFGIGTEQMYYIDANAAGGQGTTTIAGTYKAAPNAAATVDTANNVGPTMSAVMFAPGKVLTVGGNSYQNGSGNAGSRKATVIDLNGGGAVLAEQPAMANARNFANTIVLPDGKVLVTGGETRANNDPAFGVFAAEQWNPATGTWSTLASAAVFRGYHSQTSLLTNGTVLSSGGGTPGPIQLKGEVYYPPYLFRSVGGTAQLAPRPQIVGISGLAYASGAPLQFDMASTATVSQVALVGLSIGTHSFNAGQRRIPLAITQEGIRITTTLPAATLAPPGYYQVIALDAAGVPSRGSVIAVGQGVNPPSVPVSPYTPPDLSGTINAPGVAAGGIATYTVTAAAGVTYSWSFGDGSAATAFSPTASTTHAYANAGVYGVTLTARAADGSTSTRTFLQAVTAPATAGKPVASSATALEARVNASTRLWVANPDTDTVAVIDTASNTRVAEIGVGSSPRSVAVAPDGRVWVTNKGSSTISIVNPTTLAVAATVALPRAAQPHGLVFAPGGSAFVVFEATGQLLKLDAATGATQATLGVGANPRHLSATANGATVLVSRFITNPLPGEATAAVDTATAGAEVLAINAGTMTLAKTLVLRHSDKVDNPNQGSGIPNYLAAAVVSPDGQSAWVPSKQDNIKRGTLRNAQGLDFQNSVRAISSRIDMATLAEDYARRIDHDNSSLGSAAAFHPAGAYLFVALETSRQVAVVDAAGGRELAKVDVGRAPQAVSVSADGTRLFVQNFMDRSVTVLDLGPLTTQGLLNLPVLATVGTVGTEKLASAVLQGKRLFYDARDPRLARDSYMSCASCHSDAGHDGRTWDFTGFGEGLRNTPALKGRAGIGQGFVHWSANFDEIQDFEGQIRNFAGGTGLMSDAQFNTGTRNTPLGDRKAGIAADLDALAAYLGSLNEFEATPLRNIDGTLTAAATAGKAVFTAANCAGCHNGAPFTASADAASLRSIGTVKPASGQRLGAALTGIDVPTLRDVWKTAPYLHDGSAGTLAAAVQAHAGTTVVAADLANLVAYLQQIGAEEAGPGAATPPTNLAPSAALATSYVSPWESLPAVNNNIVPANSADKNGGAYGNWQDPVNYGRTDWVSFSWTTPRLLTAFEVYWWNDGQGIATPTAAQVEYWNGGAWVALGAPGLALDTFNRLDFAAVSTTSIRVAMSSPSATGILEVRIWGTTGTSPNTAPSVAITAPAANAGFVAGAAITVSANAADSDGTVAKVEFFDGATLIGTDTAAPWSVAWANAATGAHTLTARATDNAGAATTSAAVPLTVTAATSTPPANAVTCANENGTCTLPAGATATVWYGANSSWVTKTGVTGSIACTNAEFTDPLPGIGKACRYVVTSAPANLAPSVAVTAPANNARVTQGAVVSVTATAADSDGTVARVEFYDGAALLGTDTTVPFAFSWTGAAVGTHSITAKAFDNAGAGTTSAAVALVVAAPAAAPPASAVTCARQNRTCTLPAGRTATVWYGAGTRWALKTGVSGSIGCNNATFGDPIVGITKSCRYVAN